MQPLNIPQQTLPPASLARCRADVADVAEGRFQRRLIRDVDAGAEVPTIAAHDDASRVRLSHKLHTLGKVGPHFFVQRVRAVRARQREHADAIGVDVDRARGASHASRAREGAMCRAPQS